MNLDDLPPRTAVIATSNRDMRALSDRFDTRFAPIEIKSPTDTEIADFLVKQWRVPRKAADFIAIGACGNSPHRFYFFSRLFVYFAGKKFPCAADWLV